MPNTSKRGFASMDGDKQRMIASKGGKAAHAKGTAHEWSSEEARAAGRKGGESRGTRGRVNAQPIVSSNFLTQAGSSLRSIEQNSTNPFTANSPATPIGDFKHPIAMDRIASNVRPS
jgi:hypothetical protein